METVQNPTSSKSQAWIAPIVIAFIWIKVLRRVYVLFLRPIVFRLELTVADKYPLHYSLQYVFSAVMFYTFVLMMSTMAYILLKNTTTFVTKYSVRNIIICIAISAAYAIIAPITGLDLLFYGLMGGT